MPAACVPPFVVAVAIAVAAVVEPPKIGSRRMDASGAAGRRRFARCLCEGQRRQTIGQVRRVGRRVGRIDDVGVIGGVGGARGAGGDGGAAAGAGRRGRQVRRDLRRGRGEVRRQVERRAGRRGVVDVERIGQGLREIVGGQRAAADDVDRVMHADDDAAVGIGRPAIQHALIFLRDEHREQDRVCVGVGGMARRERWVGAEPAEGCRIETIDLGRRDLIRPRTAVDVLAGLLVGHHRRRGRRRCWSYSADRWPSAACTRPARRPGSSCRW